MKRRSFRSSTGVESMDTNASEPAPFAALGERDEVQEVKKTTKNDTSRIRLWRLLVTFLLLCLALAVTGSIYKFLIDEQTTNFETAYDQFSGAVASAALEQQESVREALKGLSRTITAHAMKANATWPFFTMPAFEAYGGESFRVQSQAEMLMFGPIVDHKDREEFVKWSIKNYRSWVEEGWNIRGKEKPAIHPFSYFPFISRPALEGPVPFVPDIDRETYYVSWQTSPPPRSYALINWNMGSVPDYDQATKAMIALKNETVVTRVRPYAAAIGLQMTAEEHEAMHSKLLDSDVENPHSMILYPVRREINDNDSDIVAGLGASFAWDAALLNLLPQDVSLMAVISNNCNQSYTYHLLGKDALFMGEGDQHDSKYDEHQVAVPLDVHGRTDFSTTPGHCQYKMVSLLFADSLLRSWFHVVILLLTCLTYNRIFIRPSSS